MAENELASLRAEMPEPPEDRGTKNRARPLTSYFQGRAGFMLIRAGYSNAGQAARGLRSLTVNSNGDAPGAVCLVALRADVFESLWRRSPATGHVPGPGNGNVWSRPHGAHLLLECFHDEGVPEPLKGKLVGDSPEMELVRKLVVRAANLDHNVLILGETGTGKDIVASQIHHLSARRGKPFVVVNCASLPENLLESELFGHAKGAFTGATSEKAGLWATASGGTLFLDEIGDLSPLHQTKLLRALECGRFTPVGHSKEVKSDARVVAATNRNLAMMVRAGQFREDLYFRLHMLDIRTPPLRVRIEDVPVTADHLWRLITKAPVAALPAGVKSLLCAYHWPGNVRELNSFLSYLHFLFGHRELMPGLVEAAMEDRLGVRTSSSQDG